MAETMYVAIGGAEGCRALAEAFYGRVDSVPLLRPFFPGKTHKCAVEAFAAFLVQFLGGPAEESQPRWFLSLRESHARFTIGEEHRNAWMKTMSEALDEVEITEPTRAALRQFFEKSSAYLVNHGSGSVKDPELDQRWTVQRGLDDLIATIHGGNSELAMSMAENLIPQLPSRSVVAGVLATMIRNGLKQYVREKLTEDPSLIHERYWNRTLLHVAAGAGDRDLVELLLQLGADPNELDGGKHTPLYSLANECSVGGGNVVRVLVDAGARVDACDGVKRCTPLHMAARRGNTEIAAALLECGANIEARDRQGVTPLQRALNCRKTMVANLLTGGSFREVG